MTTQPQVKAILARMQIRMFSNSRTDGETTSEVLNQKGSEDGAGRWIKNVFPKDALFDITHTAGLLRGVHYDLTLPWEAGYRLLPITTHPKYVEQTNQGIALCKAHVTQFIKDYDKHLAAAKTMHGKSFEAHLYPTRDHVNEYFSFHAEFSPIPKAAHFLTDGLAGTAVAEMKEELENRNKTLVDAAVKDTFTRLLTPVQKLADRLSDSKPVFRDSLIENIREALALIPVLNLTNDAKLTATAAEIEKKFAFLDPGTLRDSASTRKQVGDAAKLLCSQFGQIGKRRFA